MKNNIHKKPINIRFIYHKHNLILFVDEKEDKSKGVAKFKYSLRSIESAVDRADPRSLNLFYVKDVR